MTKHPKSKPGWLHRVVFVCCAGLVVVALGQNYAVDWFKVAGGGGKSTNSQYSVTGTIGQLDANGPMTNGRFSVSGGFWTVYAIQVDGGPWLTITPVAPTSAKISWSQYATGYVLQETLNLSSTNWVNSPSGSNNPVVVPAALPVRYYRLFRQP